MSVERICRFDIHPRFPITENANPMDPAARPLNQSAISFHEFWKCPGEQSSQGFEQDVSTNAHIAFTHLSQVPCSYIEQNLNGRDNVGFVSQK
jgi:hypothetical protein